MKTTKRWLFGLLAAALFVSCSWESNTDVDFRLYGTWESTDTSLYSGKLVIDYDTITITGYIKSQTPPEWQDGDDAERPFKDFARDFPLTYYTEDGKLFIETVEDIRSVPYKYSEKGPDKYLLFTFGGRPEGLKQTANY
jgi:hypothetical protein